MLAKVLRTFHITAVKPAAVQKNTVKPVAIEIMRSRIIMITVMQDQHRDRTFRALFILDAQY